MTAEAIDHAPTPLRPAPPALRAVTAPVYLPLSLCVCGHEPDAHEDELGGCGVCGTVRCRGFRRRTGRGARSPFRRRVAR